MLWSLSVNIRPWERVVSQEFLWGLLMCFYFVSWTIFQRRRGKKERERERDFWEFWTWDIKPIEPLGGRRVLFWPWIMPARSNLLPLYAALEVQLYCDTIQKGHLICLRTISFFLLCSGSICQCIFILVLMYLSVFLNLFLAYCVHNMN